MKYRYVLIAIMTIIRILSAETDEIEQRYTEKFKSIVMLSTYDKMAVNPAFYRLSEDGVVMMNSDRKTESYWIVNFDNSSGDPVFIFNSKKSRNTGLAQQLNENDVSKITDKYIDNIKLSMKHGRQLKNKSILFSKLSGCWQVNWQVFISDYIVVGEDISIMLNDETKSIKMFKSSLTCLDASDKVGFNKDAAIEKAMEHARIKHVNTDLRFEKCELAFMRFNTDYDAGYAALSKEQISERANKLNRIYNIELSSRDPEGDKRRMQWIRISAIDGGIIGVEYYDP